MSHEGTEQTPELTRDDVLVGNLELSLVPRFTDAPHERHQDLQGELQGRNDGRRSSQDRFSTLNVEPEDGREVVLDDRIVDRLVTGHLLRGLADDSTQVFVLEACDLTDRMPKLGRPTQKNEPPNLATGVSALVSVGPLWTHGLIASLPNSNRIGSKPAEARYDSHWV